MTTELHICDLRILRAEGETLAEARSRLPREFPRRSARRMTHLGTLMARILAGHDPGLESTLVYGTTYAETRSLEDYVDSFPTPSPLLFQGSIHPSGIQQVFVHRKIPVGNFIPITGKDYLVASMLKAAFLAGDESVAVCGGEERGTWLLECGRASAEAFAWGFTLSRFPVGSTGSLFFEPGPLRTAPEPVDHLHFVSALEQRSFLEIPHPAGGGYRIEWK